MSGTGLLSAYGGMAANPTSAEELQFYKNFPYKFINQSPAAMQAGMTAESQGAATSAGQSSGQGLAPGYADGGTATAQPTAQQLVDAGIEAPGQAGEGGGLAGAGSIGAGTMGGNGNAAGGLASGMAGNTAGGITGGIGSGGNLAGAMGAFGGAAAPNVASLAQANGMDPGLSKAAFSGLTSLAGPVGMGLSAANLVGGIANTMANGSMLAAAGAPMSTAQYVGGFLGVNGYNGTPSTARASMMASPDITEPALTNLVGATTIGMSQDPNDVAGMNDGNSPSADTQASAGEMSGQGGDGSNDNSSAGAGGGDDGGDHAGFAVGGVIKNSTSRGFLRDLAKGSGLVKGLTGGRADAIHTSVPRGAYVMPADVVSGMGGGNTLAGAKFMTGSLKSLPKLPGFKNGGDVQPVKVRLSSGEFVVHPAHAAALGRGSLDLGHQVLDQLVKIIRQRVAQQALTAPPPK